MASAAPPDATELRPTYPELRRSRSYGASDLEMRPLVARCHFGLGRLDRRTGNSEQAQEHLTTATAMYTQSRALALPQEGGNVALPALR